ncbi:MAG TPA: SAM-dependent methyltransferase [Streptosporangiaceae bacterium]
MSSSDPIPGVDPFTASAARVYDYMLGGKDHYAVDRELGERLLANAPISPWIAQQNRLFLGRAVRYCAEQGLRQFLDLGSGLPTQENVHEVAQRVDPDCRVAYVDNDPVAVVHAQGLLAGADGVVAVRGDLRRPAEILANDDVLRLIDFSRPVVVLMVAILHFILDDEDPAGIVAEFFDAVPPGSYLVLSHATHDIHPESATVAREIYRRASSPLVTRTRPEVGKLLEGLEPVDPGLVFISEWRPTQKIANPERSGLYAAVARKPG